MKLSVWRKRALLASKQTVAIRDDETDKKNNLKVVWNKIYL